MVSTARAPSERRIRGTLFAAACSLTVAAAMALPQASDAGKASNRCAIIKTRSGYSDGKRLRFGIYIESGHVTCHKASSVLRGVLQGRGKQHTAPPYDTPTYISYKGWSCPNGHMGYQACVVPNGTPSDVYGPSSAQILARECGPDPGCPTRVRAR